MFFPRFLSSVLSWPEPISSVGSCRVAAKPQLPEPATELPPPGEVNIRLQFYSLADDGVQEDPSRLCGGRLRLDPFPGAEAVGLHGVAAAPPVGGFGKHRSCIY